MNAKLALCVQTALCLAACGSGDTPPHGPRETPQNFTPAAPIARALPATERLAKDLVMAPIGHDQRGCVIYQLESQSRPALRSAFYRTQAGDFSTIEEEAACT
jgi:hypothetical protein